MKKIMLFKLRFCGYCRQALKYLDTLIQENPHFRELEIEQIDESKERNRAAQYDYYYVPTFYIGEEKVHEGPVDLEKVREILQRAYDEN